MGKKSFYVEAVYTDSVLGWHLYALQLVFIGESFLIFHQQPLRSLISCTICNCNTVDVLNKAHNGSNRAEGCNFLVIHMLRSWRLWGDLLELQSQFTDYLKRRHCERVFSDQNHLREQSRAAENKVHVHSHGKFTKQRGKMTAPASEKLMEWGVKLNPFGLRMSQLCISAASYDIWHISHCGSEQWTCCLSTYLRQIILYTFG